MVLYLKRRGTTTWASAGRQISNFPKWHCPLSQTTWNHHLGQCWTLRRLWNTSITVLSQSVIATERSCIASLLGFPSAISAFCGFMFKNNEDSPESLSHCQGAFMHPSGCFPSAIYLFFVVSCSTKTMIVLSYSAIATEHSCIPLGVSLGPRAIFVFFVVSS